MPFDLATSDVLSSISKFPKAFRLGTAYYLGDGRNAWHRTWSVYNRRQNISLDPSELKGRAERLRTQGSKFHVQSVPLLQIHYDDFVLGLVETRSNRSRGEYLGLCNDISRLRKTDWWRVFFDNAASTVFLICYRETPSKQVFYRQQRLSSFSYGSVYPLGWRFLNQSETFDEFIRFQQWLRRRLNRLRRNSNAKS
jgi:hypothetical protein